MIREIKRRYTKFGTIISSYVPSVDTREDAKNLEAMNAFSAFVSIHTIGREGEIANGVSYYHHKSGPKLKNAVGHHISLIRGDQVFAFVLPSVKFLGDIQKVYEFAESNRMERAYGFFVGHPEHPSVVAFTGALADHLFHAIPDNLEMVGNDWIKWIHEWAPKAMMTHRYFDANDFVAVAIPEVIAPETVVVGGITIENEPLLEPTPEVQVVPEIKSEPAPDVIEKPIKKKRKWNPFS